MEDKEQGRLLAAILDAIPDVIGVQDTQHGVILYNEAGYRFVGKSPEQIQNLRCFELFGHKGPCADCVIEEALRTRQPAYRERYFEERDLWMDVRAYPVFDEQGEIVRLVEHLRDVTQRKRTEAALRGSEARYRAIFNATSDGILLINAETGRIADANESALRMLRASWEEVVDADVAHFSHGGPPYSDAEMRGRLARALAGEPQLFEWWQRRKNGELFWAEVTLSRAAFDGPASVIATVRDVTEERRLTQRLEHAQRMETVGQLAGGVAHDFNNLLAPMLGFSDLLLEELDPGHPHVPVLQMIRHAAGRARELTQQLLAFGRKQMLQMRAVELNQLIYSQMGLLRRMIREDIAIRFEPSPRPATVLGDEAQLEQVLLNLAMNARDAITGAGQLWIATAVAYVDDQAVAAPEELHPGLYVTFTVGDSGCGIDADTMVHIFEPFFTTKELGRGTGLGLATVFGIIKQHQGHLVVQSDVGAGTTFTIYLPYLAGSTVSPAPSASEPVGAGSGETVVVVEDNAIVRNLTRDMLRRFGYRVFEAEDADECLRLLGEAQRAPDLLLTDVVLPGLNGQQLFDRLRERFPSLRVIYMSGYAEEVVQDRVILGPGIELLPKPFTLADLIERVRRALAAGPHGGR